jgi:arginine decarboxylase
MGTGRRNAIQVVWGTGSGPTELAAYDTALAAAGVHNYNLITLSSVVPPTYRVVEPGTAQDLGPIGGQLRVVEAKTVTADDSATAGLGWAVGEKGGVFIETHDTESREQAATEITQGLETAIALRDWEFETRSKRIVSSEATGPFVAAVVLAIYDTSTPLYLT